MELIAWQLAWAHTRARWAASRASDDGEVSLTTVILAFVLAGLALSVGAIIVAKVTAKANAIPVD
ncbi:MAG: hypothetical protein ACKO91_06660 [Acidimicrobiales bacterium]